jgi:hypothetical protein
MRWGVGVRKIRHHFHIDLLASFGWCLKLAFTALKKAGFRKIASVKVKTEGIG